MDLSHRFSMLLASLIVASLPVLAHAEGAQTWTLTTADFNTEAVTLAGLDDAGLHVTAEGAKERLVKSEQFLQLERTLPAVQPQGKLMLHMFGGDRLGGEPISIGNDNIVWNAQGIGEIAVPLSRLIGITKPNALAPEGKKLEDVVVLSNGDTVRGIISGLAGGKLSVKTEGADEALPVPFDAVVSVQFASTGAGAKDDKGYRVRLDDGSSLVAQGLKLAGEKLELRMGAAADSVRPIDLTHVAAIEQVSGPAVFLSSRDPAENVYIPFFGTDQDYPARMNQTVSGNRDLRFGGRSFRRGIGVHSYSRLSWPLDGKYAAFRTQYGIEDDKTRADVTVRVKLDDKVAYEKKNVRAGVLSPVIVIDLAGAKKLTLEVDYGENLHVDDHLTWLSPVLMKTKPADPAPEKPTGVNITVPEKKPVDPTPAEKPEK